jgi:site-specific DNA-adenine methylase
MMAKYSTLKPWCKIHDMHIKRIVEPYIGSGGFSINMMPLDVLGYDLNPDICEMWWWLQSCDEKDLDELHRFVELAKSNDEKPDVKLMGLDIGPQTYVRVNVCSLVVGQLSSWKVYPQNKLPIDKTKECLHRIRSITIENRSANEYSHCDGDLLFLDPPYVGTSGNYIGGSVRDGKGYDTQSTVDLISSTGNPIVFTYGTDAPTVFPMYDWIEVSKRKVPNMRKGGTTDRVEHISFINWP